MIAYRAVSHGRVNLIGEHTDYNGGWVLPTLIPQSTTIQLTVRQDNEVHASTSALHLKGSEGLHYKLGEETPTRNWIDYIQGATKILSSLGYALKGFDIRIDSDVPTGSGLSSSAALEVSILKALREAFHLEIPDVEIARIGQRIENEFVGARVGIMDQMACGLAQEGEAFFLDTQNLTFERIPIPLEDLDLIVINSGIKHQHSAGDYNQRRAECEEACRQLGIQSLREFNIQDLPKLDQLAPTLKKRARHVVTENDRVHKAVDALKRRDLSRLGQLFYESHQSMSHDYEVSIPEIDLLVELCRKNPHTIGARLTGGGFGGSIVALTEKNMGAKVAREVVGEYERSTHHRAHVLVPRMGDVTDLRDTSVSY